MVREAWRPEMVKKKADEEVKRVKRYSAWEERKREEAEAIVNKRKEELRKINEHARGKAFTDEEWEALYNEYIRGEK